MVDYQFRIKPEHQQFVQKVNTFLNRDAITRNYTVHETKDGTVFIMEFKEHYQANKFEQDLKINFPYLFVE